VLCYRVAGIFTDRRVDRQQWKHIVLRFIIHSKSRCACKTETNANDVKRWGGFKKQEDLDGKCYDTFSNLGTFR